MNRKRKIISILGAIALFGLTINIATSEKKEKSMLGYVLSPFAWTGQKIGEGYETFKQWRAIRDEVGKREAEIEFLIEKAENFDELVKRREETRKIVETIKELQDFTFHQINHAGTELKEFRVQAVSKRVQEIIQEKTKKVTDNIEAIKDTLKEAQEESQRRTASEIFQKKGIDVDKYKKRIDESIGKLIEIWSQLKTSYEKAPLFLNEAKKTVEKLENIIFSLDRKANKKLEAIKRGEITSKEEQEKYQKAKKKKEGVEKFEKFLGEKKDFDALMNNYAQTGDLSNIKKIKELGKEKQKAIENRKINEDLKSKLIENSKNRVSYYSALLIYNEVEQSYENLLSGLKNFVKGQGPLVQPAFPATMIDARLKEMASLVTTIFKPDYSKEIGREIQERLEHIKEIEPRYIILDNAVTKAIEEKNGGKKINIIMQALDDIDRNIEQALKKIEAEKKKAHRIEKPTKEEKKELD